MSATPPAECAPQRGRSVVLYLFSNQLQTALAVLVGLFSTPLLLAWLGPERYGLQRVLEAWSAPLGVGSSGLMIAAGVALLPLLGRQEERQANAVIAAAGMGLLGLTCVGLLSGGVMLLALPWLAPAPEELSGERFWAFVLGWGALCLVPLPLCRCLLEAGQRGYRVNLSLTVHSLCLTGCALALAYAGWGLPGQALAVLAAAVVQMILLLAWTWRDFAWLAPWRTDRSTLKTLATSAAGLTLLAALGVVGARVEQISVNYAGGPAAVAAYLLTQRLFSLGLLQLAAISSATWAPLGDLYHRGETESFARRVGDCQTLIAGLAYAGGLPLLAHVKDFLRLWVGEESYAGESACLAFALALPILGLQSFHGWLLTATGHSRRSLPGVLLYTCVSVGFCSGLGWLIGPEGVAWGVLAASGGVLFWFNAHAIRASLGLSWRSLVGPYFRATLLAIPVGVAAFALARAYEAHGWFDLAARMSIVSICYLALWWWLALPAEERSRWRDHLSRLLNRAG